MNLLRHPVRFFVRPLSIRLSLSRSYITTHQAPQSLLKPICGSPSASRLLLRFFKSISRITSSSAGVSSVSGKQGFCNSCTNGLRSVLSTVCLLPILCLQPLRHIEQFVQSSQSPGTQLLVVSVQKRFEFFAGTEQD